MPKAVYQQIGSVTLVVESYDAAIEFYTKKLDFKLVEDNYLGDGKRWVLVSPTNCKATKIVIAQATTPLQQKEIGNQAGGRVLLFLHSNDFWRDYENYKSKGVRFLEEPHVEDYGTVVVFADLYGNKWDLLQLNETTI